jgi:hypothetical protein
MYSHRDDVSLANPFGPVTVGWKSVTETAGRRQSNVINWSRELPLAQGIKFGE